MYYPGPFENICYAEQHINTVINEIKVNFPKYFNVFFESKREPNIKDLIEKDDIKKNFYAKESYQHIINESIDDFNRDREKYLEIFMKEAFDEYEDDPNNFKNKVLRKDCPIIRTLLHIKSNGLDFPNEFNKADPSKLLSVIRNLVTFADNYKKNFYNPESFEKISNIKELKFSELLDEKYQYKGVIGSSLKSYFLYKLYPEIFPNQSRQALWALWYLTKKKPFDCKQQSEFIMIDNDNNTLEANSFYPYDLFGIYSIEIYKMLKEEAKNLNINLVSEYRFVILDYFLDFIAKRHKDEIEIYTRNLRSYGYL